MEERTVVYGVRSLLKIGEKQGTFVRRSVFHSCMRRGLLYYSVSRPTVGHFIKGCVSNVCTAVESFQTTQRSANRFIGPFPGHWNTAGAVALLSWRTTLAASQLSPASSYNVFRGNACQAKTRKALGIANACPWPLIWWPWAYLIHG